MAATSQSSRAFLRKILAETVVGWMKNGFSRYSSGVVALLLLLSMMTTYAEEPSTQGDIRQWSVAPIIGYYKPALKQINQGVFKSPIRLRANTLDDFGSPIEQDFLIKNSLPELGFDAESGIEFRWKMSSKDDFLVGFASWESASESTTSGKFPLQTVIGDTESRRTSKLSFNDFFLGWRRNIFSSARNDRLYFSLSLHELFDIDYQENISIKFSDLPFQTSGGLSQQPQRIMILRGQATGGLMLQLGGGGEYFVTEWFSVGVEADYSVSLNRVKLRAFSRRTDFRTDDNINLEELRLPIDAGDDGNVDYLSEDGSQYKNLGLDFSGFKFLFKVGLYF